MKFTNSIPFNAETSPPLNYHYGAQLQRQSLLKGVGPIASAVDLAQIRNQTTVVVNRRD